MAGRRSDDASPRPEGAPRPFGWFPDWRDRVAVVVGSGPSAKGQDLEAAKGQAGVLTVNESWRLAPWADALYACDDAWWRARRGVPDFPGLKICGDERTPKAFPEIRRVRPNANVDAILMREAGRIGYGGNSGFQAVNLALQFGSRRIVLVGFDLHLADGVHWHGRHAANLNNPSAQSLARWAVTLDRQAPAIAALGVEVLNTSPQSALTAYRKVPLEEALA
ncbi:MAG: hypothetical protein U1C74_34260 [Phenylobacterium sp.]|nr:hypothetical protein [Phenylobacterium sp.]